MTLKFSALIFTLAFLAACQNAQYPESNPVLSNVDAQCHQLITEFRLLVDSAAAADASARPISGFPLIHVNRFLDGAAKHISSEQQLTDWFELVIPLSLNTRTIENSNLPEPWNEIALNRLAQCSQLAASNNQYRAAMLSHINNEAYIDNNYIGSRQWLGIYPLMRPFYLLSIRNLHRKEKQLFDKPDNFALANVYTPSYTPTGVRPGINDLQLSGWFDQALSTNSLAIPVLTDEKLLQLFQHHAPDLRIEHTGEQDLLSSPVWSDDQLILDSTKPQTFFLPSYTNFAGHNLLQLNYVFWFPERQPRRLIDLYSGRFDGLIWRVTLDHRGQVLLYDSIHPCGCYHKYFVSSDHVGILESSRSKEPANIFRVNELNTNLPITISLTSNEHYVVGVNNSTLNRVAQATQYTLRPHRTLTQLDKSGQAKSMFDHRGLVPGSERLERFTLWPTGILSVGAMRQYGTHATGFIEEQQFDDYNLLDLYFDYYIDNQK